MALISTFSITKGFIFIWKSIDIFLPLFFFRRTRHQSEEFRSSQRLSRCIGQSVVRTIVLLDRQTNQHIIAAESTVFIFFFSFSFILKTKSEFFFSLVLIQRMKIFIDPVRFWICQDSKTFKWIVSNNCASTWRTNIFRYVVEVFQKKHLYLRRKSEENVCWIGSLEFNGPVRCRKTLELHYLSNREKRK